MLTYPTRYKCFRFKDKWLISFMTYDMIHYSMLKSI